MTRIEADRKRLSLIRAHNHFDHDFRSKEDGGWLIKRLSLALDVVEATAEVRKDTRATLADGLWRLMASALAAYEKESHEHNH